MKKSLLILCFAAAFPLICDGYDESAELDWATEATREYGQALKSELQAAMHMGGTMEAIETCSTKALLIGEEMSRANGENVSRVSLHNRNPENAPNEWQKAVLMDFENRKQAGEKAGALTWHEVAETENGLEFRFMKAIPTGPICLQCHGSNIAPPVAEKLNELYPGDKATGFDIGDIRGAFVVTRPVDR